MRNSHLIISLHTAQCDTPLCPSALLVPQTKGHEDDTIACCLHTCMYANSAAPSEGQNHHIWWHQGVINPLAWAVKCALSPKSPAMARGMGALQELFLHVYGKPRRMGAALCHSDCHCPCARQRMPKCPPARRVLEGQHCTAVQTLTTRGFNKPNSWRICYVAGSGHRPACMMATMEHAERPNVHAA